MDRLVSLEARRIDLAFEAPFELGRARVEPAAHEITIAGASARLQPQTMKVLIALRDRAGQVVSRDELVDRCWDGRIVGEDVINRCISLLRKVATDAGGFAIETVPKAGYRLTVAKMAPAGAKRRWPTAAALALLLVAGGAGLFAYRSTRNTATTNDLQVRLADFTPLSGGVAPEFLQSIRDQTLAAFADDGAIGVNIGSHGDRYQLSGSVERRGAGYAVITRIDNIRTGAALWSHGFDYPSGDRDRVSRDVALNLATVARCGFGRAVTYPKALPDQTLRLLFAGCDNDGTINNDQDRALDFARRVTLASPNFSFGWSLVASIAVGLGPQRPPAEAAALARETNRALATALRLDPQNSEVWALRAYALPAGKLVEREALFKRAIAARPLDCACEHHGYGVFLREVGRLKQAQGQFRRAIDIMHIDEDFYGDLALTLFAEGDKAAAQQTAAAGRRVSRHLEEYDLLFVRSATWSGNYTKAREVLDYPSFRDDPRMHLLIQPIEALKSRDARAMTEARSAILPLTQDPATNRPLLISLLAALGDTNDALAAVQRLAATNPAAAHQVLFEPGFASVRGSPAFWDTATKLGLVDYWRKSHQRPDFCGLGGAPAGCATLG